MKSKDWALTTLGGMIGTVIAYGGIQYAPWLRLVKGVLGWIFNR